MILGVQNVVVNGTNIHLRLLFVDKLDLLPLFLEFVSQEELTIKLGEELDVKGMKEAQFFM